MLIVSPTSNLGNTADAADVDKVNVPTATYVTQYQVEIFYPD